MYFVDGLLVDPLNNKQVMVAVTSAQHAYGQVGLEALCEAVALGWLCVHSVVGHACVVCKYALGKQVTTLMMGGREKLS
jgi:hypothetical protein